MTRPLSLSLVLPVVLLAVAFADEPSREALRQGEVTLDALRSVDALYEGPLSLSGTENIGRELMRPGDPGGLFHWRFTRNADEVVLHTRRVEGEKPEYVVPGESSFADYDPEGNMITRVLIEELHHFSPEERFRLQRFQQNHISPDGVVRHEEICDVIAFFGPYDDEPTLPIKRALWSMGRGFAPYLQEVIECRRRDDGTREIMARGFESRASNGRWKLVIDESRSFLVTAASYTREGRDEPTIVLENLGEQGEGPCAVAGNATWSVNLGYHTERTHRCDVAQFRTDEELLEIARNAKRGPFPATALALDKRSGVYRSLDKQRMRRPPKHAAIGPTERVSNFFWLFSAHLAIGGLAYLAYRGTMRSRMAAGRPGDVA